MAVAFAWQLVPEASSPELSRFIVASFYPLGFVVCVMSGTLLFTEQTATAFYPILDHRIALRRVAPLFSIILLGNFVGTVCSAVLITLTNEVLQLREGFHILADHVVGPSNLGIFLSAVLAGWLMAQGGWLILAASQSIAQIVCIYIVTFLIGILGLHHSIVSSAELFSAWLLGFEMTWLTMMRVLFLAVLGNLLGGIIFVALLNYGHIRSMN